MKTFCGGQLLPKARANGDLSVVFYRVRPKSAKVTERYGGFPFEICCGAFVRTTSSEMGDRVERVYMGLNPNYATRLTTAKPVARMRSKYFGDLDRIVLFDDATPFDIFVGGQIDPEIRGDLALVVSKDGFYEVNAYHPLDEEFIYLTTPGEAQIERVYIGVNNDVAAQIGNISVALNHRIKTLDDLDRDLVDDYFISRGN